MNARTRRNGTIIALSVALFLAHSAIAHAQGIIDGFTRGMGKSDLAISYTTESYDKFWVGGEEMDTPPPLGTITTNSVGFFLAHGITNDLDLVASVAHISASGDGEGGPPDQSGWQDGSLYLKWRPYYRQIEGSGALSLITAAGISGPMSDYVADAPIAIGHRSTNFDLRAVLQYSFDFGLFAAFQAGYTRKSDIVPDGADVSGKIGYIHPDLNFYVDAWVERQNAQEGTTIGDGIPFTSNMVSYTRMGLKAYYPVLPYLGLTAGFGTTLDGRNTGQATILNGGLVFKPGNM